MNPPRRPPRIGLTGGIGSGKSTIAGMLAAHGAAIIDSDAIAHELTAAGGAAIEPIRKEFGAQAIDADGALDRRRMRALVFADPAARARLEGILHPLINDRCVREALARADAPLLVFDIPLLAEGPGVRAALALDSVLVVDCPPERQVANVVARGSMQGDEVLAVIAAQAPRAARLSLADEILVNCGTIESLRMRVDRLWVRYGREAAV